MKKLIKNLTVLIVLSLIIFTTISNSIFAQNINIRFEKIGNTVEKFKYGEMKYGIYNIYFENLILEKNIEFFDDFVLRIKTLKLVEINDINNDGKPEYIISIPRHRIDTLFYIIDCDKKIFLFKCTPKKNFGEQRNFIYNVKDNPKIIKEIYSTEGATKKEIIYIWNFHKNKFIKKQ